MGGGILRGKVFCACTLCFLLAIALPALAQESDLGIADEAGLQAGVVGLGVGSVPDYEGSDDYEAVPLIQARYSWANQMNISLLGNTVRANLVPDEEWHAGPLIRFRKERDDVDNDKVDRLEKVDSAVELGAFGSVQIDRWRFMVTVAKDVADGHEGFLVGLNGAYRIPFKKQALLTIFGSTTYADDDYMEAYFEIDAADSDRSDLDPFEAEAGFKDVAIGAAYQYNIDDRWGVLGVARYSRLLEDAEDSPVVDDEGEANQFLIGVLANYRF